MKKHTVRKRIFISHAMMILVTIFFMFLVNLGIVKIYWERMEQEWQFSMETMADTASVEELLKEWTLHQRSFYMLLAAGCSDLHRRADSGQSVFLQRAGQLYYETDGSAGKRRAADSG